MTTAIGVDVGGTNVRAALVAADGSVLASDRAPSPRGDGPALLDTMTSLVAGLGDGGELPPVGVGVAGSITGGSQLRFSPNLELAEVELRTALATRLGVTPTVLNDATAAAWGEHRAGAARGVDDVVLVTLGTGVGGGVIAGGRLLGGATGIGAELGHLTVATGGRPCPCGNDGCLEAYASGAAMALDGRTAAQVEADARAGDATALDHLRSVGVWLGIGLASLVNVLDPALVVIGGGAGQHAFDLLAPTATATMERRIFGAAHREPPRVVPAELGDDAGVVGAALHALDVETGHGGAA